MAATVDKTYYVYGLYEPDTGVVRYIGRGKKDRWRRHFRAADRHYNPMMARMFSRYGQTVQVRKIAEGMTYDEATALEVRLIAETGRGRKGPLYNMTDGGDGMAGHVPTNAHREKIAESNRRRRLSPETRAKIAASRLGQKPSPEHRAALSASRIGNTNARGNKGNKRAPFSAEHRAKLSAAAKSYKTFLGRSHSEETKAKISAARKVMFAAKGGIDGCDSR